jgi:hypothetical protein
MEAFIVHFWIETRDMNVAEPIWLGVIEHVGSGARVYFDKLDEISKQIIPFIEAMGVKIDKSRS